MTEPLDIEAIRHNALSLRQEASAPGGDPAMLTLAEDAVRLCDEVERLRDHPAMRIFNHGMADIEDILLGERKGPAQ